MRKIICASIFTLVFVLTVMVFNTSLSFALTPDERLTSAADVVQAMGSQEDVSTMADMVKESYGVVIIPSFYKGAIGLGGTYGEGVVLRHDPATGRWYGPSFMNISGISYGLQIGLQSTALLLVVSNSAGMEHFYGDTVKLGADVSVAAGPVGRSAGAATYVNMKASIYSYSISKGLFAGVSLGGSVMATDEEANSSYWGEGKYNSREILLKRASSPKVQPLLSSLRVLVEKASK